MKSSKGLYSSCFPEYALSDCDLKKLQNSLLTMLVDVCKINFLHTVNCSFLKSLSLNQLPFRHSRSVDSLLLFPISVEELA